MSPFDLTRTGRRAVLVVAVVTLLLGVVLCAAGAASTTILPLGDSITHGSADRSTGVFHLSYRYWLWSSLQANGYDVDFIGSLSTPNFTLAFDNDNDGHAGYTSGEILDSLPAWLAASEPPAIVLVHIGTNDVMAGLSPTETVENLRGIVALLRARNPGVVVLIAQVIPTASEERNTEIAALNAAIADLQSLSAPGSPVIVVDQFSGYDGVLDNQDGGVHPRESGERKMASRWMAALLPLLPGQVSLTVVPTVAPTAVPTSVERPWSRSRTIGHGGLWPVDPGDAVGSAPVTPSPKGSASGSALPGLTQPFGRYSSRSRWTPRGR